MKKTYKQCCVWGYETLNAAGIGDARIDARLLLEYVCGTTQHDMILHGDREVDEAKREQYEACILKRAERIPLQHITGVQSFMGFDFRVNEHVLIPRQDTEILVETALGILQPGMRILDMCTGSGCILLSLLALGERRCMCQKAEDAVQCENRDAQWHESIGAEQPTIIGIGADISAEALKVARQNAQEISKQCGRAISAEFVESDLFRAFVTGRNVCSDARAEYDGLPEPVMMAECEHSPEHLPEQAAMAERESFDMIVSNPPYIASAVIDTLEPEVRLHEPMSALDGTADGLYFYRRIVTESRAYLKKGGSLLFEIGYDQGEAVKALMEAAGFRKVTVKQDYAGLDRVVYGFL